MAREDDGSSAARDFANSQTSKCRISNIFRASRSDSIFWPGSLRSKVHKLLIADILADSICVFFDLESGREEGFQVGTPCGVDARAGRCGVLRLREPLASPMSRFAQDDTTVRDHEYFVYIMCSRSGTLYIGMTNSIYRRALQHKRGETEGFSNKYHCDRLVYYESFDDVHNAIGREKQLKGWRRAKKTALIESKNPRWQDMAEKWGAEMLFAGEAIHKLSS